ncbi:MAG: prolyl oligopeptidase family serine peptidase [Alphaproteobacteria bacterium]|nr:prolyl oligopeptidase family serine peptidase [Alphaproteobacteria bacterium]
MIRTIFAAGAALLLCCATVRAAEQATPEMFGALPNVSEAAISPDGETVAAIQSAGDVRAIGFYDLTGATKPVGVKLGSVKARELMWADAGHALLLVSATQRLDRGYGLETHEIWRWVSIDRRTGRESYLFRHGVGRFYNYGSGAVLAEPPDDPGRIVMAQWAPNLDLFRVDVAKGRFDVLESGEDETYRWIVDAKGGALVRLDYDPRREQIDFYKIQPNGRFALASAVAQKREDEFVIDPLARTDAPNVIYGLMNDNMGFHRLCKFNIDLGKRASCEPGPSGYDLSGAVMDYDDARLVGVTYTDDMPRTDYLDGDLRKVQRGLEEALPGADPIITSWSRDHQTFVVRVEYTDRSPQYYLYDRAKRQLSLFAAGYNALDGKVFARKEKYDYVSSDGLTIHGYLTVPTGASKKSMPLIVLPHGGPGARDDQTFDWWSFFYAARGYLVSQPNFRGSEGYGDAFHKAGFQQWGRKMQDDITEGVKKLIAGGVADPQRICIVGASYGGYAALAGATLTPDLYACAVSYAGVTDIPAIIVHERGPGLSRGDALDAQIGAKVGDNDELKAVSPYYQASKARAPILLIHGLDDIVVPVGQSRLMRDALEAAGKTVDYVELHGEDHWLSSGESRTEMLADSIAFIDKYIGAGAAAGAAAH